MNQPTVTPRFDIYLAIHKALRVYMGETLGVLGRMDCEDEQDVSVALAQLRELLNICAGHLEHENQFVHKAMERRHPGSTLRIADEHIEHLHALDDLRAAATALEHSAAAERRSAAQRLYRQLTLFVAENFEHMQFEESEHNAVLWAVYADAELLAIEAELVASIPPAEMMVIARWMLANNDHAFRVNMLSGVRAHAPREVFEGLLAVAQSNLTGRDWRKLATALALPLAA
ncbi:MAG TPA: hypothetical protein VLC91_08145 [Spongiibacteraceae bacterium]|nr:hypothetical protein [Spongiibacteraceae bacterium]